MAFEKLIKDLKSVTGVVGIAVMNRDGTPFILDGVAESEAAQTVIADSALGEVAAAYDVGKARQILIIGSNYKILSFDYQDRIVSVFMNPNASVQAVKSKIPSR